MKREECRANALRNNKAREKALARKLLFIFIVNGVVLSLAGMADRYHAWSEMSQRHGISFHDVSSLIRVVTGGNYSTRIFYGHEVKIIMFLASTFIYVMFVLLFEMFIVSLYIQSRVRYQMQGVSEVSRD